jgi:hypothetical protein
MRSLALIVVARAEGSERSIATVAEPSPAPTGAAGARVKGHLLVVAANEEGRAATRFGFGLEALQQPNHPPRTPTTVDVAAAADVGRARAATQRWSASTSPAS